MKLEVAVLFGVLIVLQFMTSLNVLIYFPDGFWTEGYYHPAAVNLLEHGVYGFYDGDSLTPTTNRPPLYVILLAGLYSIFGAHEVIGVILNNIMLFGVFVFTYLLGRRLGPAIGFLAVIMVALDSIYLAEANRNQSDMVFSLLVVASLYAIVRALDGGLSLRRVAIVSILVGLATFTRAAGLYLWVALLIVIVVASWRVERARRIAMAGLIVIVINGAFVVPWMIRNQSITGNADFAGMKGYHLTNYFAPLFIANKKGLTYDEASKLIFSGIENDPEFQAITNQGERERYFSRFARDLILDNIPHAAWAVIENIPRMFLSYASEPLAVYLGPQGFERWYLRYQQGAVGGSAEKESLGIMGRLRDYYESGTWFIVGYGILVKILNAAVVILSVVGCVVLIFSRSATNRNVGLAVFLICGVLTLTAIVATQGRFRLPIMPGIGVAAAYILILLVSRIRGQDRPVAEHQK
ncbi:MAG: glycosyltransferase family 39 protein [Alphaproteobacteria bacterium]